MTGSAPAASQWMVVQPPIELGPDEVHVWRAPTALPRPVIARLWAVLELAEEQRALRLPRGAVRDEFVATRAALRLVLAGYAGTEAGAVRFRHGAEGKPYLTEDVGRCVHFSVSHTAGLSLIAVAATREVGIDVEPERPRRRAARIAGRLFMPATARTLERVPSAEQVPAFAAAWTQREAYAKAVGAGVFRSGDGLQFFWPRTHDICIREEHHSGGVSRVWSVAALTPAPGFAATLVAAGALDGVQQFDAAALLGA